MNDAKDKAARPPGWAKFLIDVVAVTIVLAIGIWAVRSPPDHVRRAPDAGLPLPEAMQPCVLNGAGYLSGRLYGSLNLSIDWRGPELVCDGMNRPNNTGIRLVFASSLTGDDNRLIFVIGIDGDIDRLPNKEEKANITIIDEGASHFFSTSGKDRCWTKVHSIESLSNANPGKYQVAGDLYCAGALPSLTGKGSITLGDFRYSGRLTLDGF